MGTWHNCLSACEPGKKLPVKVALCIFWYMIRFSALMLLIAPCRKVKWDHRGRPTTLISFIYAHRVLLSLAQTDHSPSPTPPSCGYTMSEVRLAVHAGSRSASLLHSINPIIKMIHGVLGCSVTLWLTERAVTPPQGFNPTELRTLKLL